MQTHPTRLAARRPPPRPLARGRPRARWVAAPADRAAAIGLAACLAAVLAGGLGAYLAVGPVAHGGFDPPGLVDHLGGVGDLLAAPFARWDSVWYLTIARDGYGSSGAETAAFFPLYPLLVAAAGALGPGILAGRQGRWARAGGLGALAAATRSQGLLLVGALGLLFFEQRRGAAPAGGGGHPRPRRREAAWLLAIPLGAAAFAAWLWLAGLDPLAPLRAQQAWYRHFTGPFAGVADGARAALAGVEQLASGQTRTVYFAAAGGDPTVVATHNLTLFAFLVAAAVPLVGALRRLPLAYGGYAAGAVILAVSYPVTPQPLMSLPRFLVVLFPLPMAVGVWLADHRRWRLPALGAGAGALAGCSGLFATWHWIA